MRRGLKQARGRGKESGWSKRRIIEKKAANLHDAGVDVDVTAQSSSQQANAQSGIHIFQMILDRFLSVERKRHLTNIITS